MFWGWGWIIIKVEQFQFCMINPHIKNCKTGFHDDVLNRTAHYKKLLQSKAKTNTKLDKMYLSNSNKQLIKSLQESKEQQNLKMFKRLIAIQRNHSRYKTESVGTDMNAKKTLKNYYKERQKSLMISEDNVRLLKKIETFQSDFSMKKLESCLPSPKIKKRNADELKKINMIDDLYYKSFRMELFRGRIESKLQRLSSKRAKDKNRKQKKFRFQTLNAYEELRADAARSNKDSEEIA